MADWLSSVQKNTATPSPAGAKKGAQQAAAPVKNDWLSSVASKGASTYKPNQLVSNMSQPASPVSSQPGIISQVKSSATSLLDKAKNVINPPNNDQPIITRAKDAFQNAVRGIKTQIGLDKEVQQVADFRKSVGAAKHDLTERESVPIFRERIKQIDELIASGKPGKTKQIPDLIPLIPEEKVANGLLRWTTGSDTVEGQLQKEKKYLEQLITGDVSSLAYQRKKLEQGKISQEEYNNLVAEQRINQVQVLKGQRASASAAIGFAQAAAGVGEAGQLIGDQIGNETLSKRSQAFADQVEEWADVNQVKDQTGLEKVLAGAGSAMYYYFLGGAIGKVAGAAAGVSPKIASWFSAIAGGSSEALSEAGSVYRTNLAQGVPKEEAIVKADKVFGANVLLNIVLERYGIRTDEAGALKRVMLAAPAEGIQEGMQQVISNTGTGRPYDEGVIESGLIGGIIGSGIAGITNSQVQITPQELAEVKQLIDDETDLEINTTQADGTAQTTTANEDQTNISQIPNELTDIAQKAQNYDTPAAFTQALASDLKAEFTAEKQKALFDQFETVNDFYVAAQDSKEQIQAEVQKKVEAEKVTSEAQQELRDYYQNADQEAVGQAHYEVIAELEVAQAGQRIYDENGNVTGGIESTFPDWVPEELRRKTLFESVLSGIRDLSNIQYPPDSQPRKQALYDEILREIDSRAGTDSGPIINKIKESYVRKEKLTTTNEGSAAGGEGAGIKLSGEQGPSHPTSSAQQVEASNEIKKRDKSPEEQGFIDIRGEKITSEVQLASLLKDFRNPNKEIFHLVYVNDGKVVAHRVISSKAHDYIDISEKETFFSIENRMKRSGATGFYTIHNHPSGITKPSYADIEFAKSINRKFGIKVQGNIILDHDNISSFNESGLLENLKVDLGVAYGSKGDPITSKQALEKFAEKYYQVKDNKVGVVVLDARSKPIIIKELNTENLFNIRFAIKQAVKENSGSTAILLTNEQDAGRFIINGEIEAIDLAYYDKNNKLVSLRTKFGLDIFSTTAGRMEKGDRPVEKIKPINEPAKKAPPVRQEAAPVENRVEPVAPVTEASNEPVTTPSGVEKKSRAYKNARDRIQEEYQQDVTYRSLNIAEEAAKSLEFVKKYPDKARRIAMGLEQPPIGFTDTAISIAAAEQAREDGNGKLQSQLEAARSLRQTRRGQEIVMEKGRVNENSAHHYMSQVLKARLEASVRVNQIVFEIDKRLGKAKSKSQRAVEAIDVKAKQLKQRIDKETLSKLESAQSLLEKLTCKI